MFKCEAMYKTPLGYIIADSEGATADEASARAQERCQFGVVQMICSRTHEERDEGAEEGREEPPAAGEDVLGPEVVTPGEQDEAPWHGNPLLGAAPHLYDAIRSLRDMGVEDDILLAFGDGNEMKVKKLGKHRLLVNGTSAAFVFKASL
ncbi:hypothetical protein [Paratractidigestivibacter faecalis]|uniref:Uncharacterized protein n=1 Tax=Paratractidigestivibacter faecalis TaxID=2292441 RepID=A0ABV1IDS1_9ACTN